MKELSFAPKLIQLQFIRDNALIIIKYQLMTLWFNNTYEKKKTQRRNTVHDLCFDIDQLIN